MNATAQALGTRSAARVAAPLPPGASSVQQTRIHCQEQPETRSGEVSTARRAFWHTFQQKRRFFSRAPPGQQHSSPKGVSHLRAAGEENFQCPSRSLISQGNFGRRGCIHTYPGTAIRAACAARAACGQLSVIRTDWPAAQTCRRRTVSGERSYGAVRKRFPGERRTLKGRRHETKYQVDRARHNGHKLDRVRSSRRAYPQLCLHATVALPVGSWLCPLEKKCDVGL